MSAALPFPTSEADWAAQLAAERARREQSEAALATATAQVAALKQQLATTAHRRAGRQKGQHGQARHVEIVLLNAVRPVLQVADGEKRVAAQPQQQHKEQKNTEADF